jgi:hypothetical protein
MMQHYYAFNAQYFAHQNKRTAFELIASHSNDVQSGPNTVIYYGPLPCHTTFEWTEPRHASKTSALLYLNAKHSCLQTIATMQNIHLCSTGYYNCCDEECRISACERNDARRLQAIIYNTSRQKIPFYFYRVSTTNKRRSIRTEEGIHRTFDRPYKPFIR